MNKSKPRWLNQDEELVWRTWLEASERMSRRVAADLRRDSGIDHGDYEVLVRLSEADGRRLRMSDLADAVVSSPSKLSQRIDRLSKAGFVERERCPSDRRGLFAVLTKPGLDALDAAARLHVESVRSHFFDHLSPDDVSALAAVIPKLASSSRGRAD